MEKKELSQGEEKVDVAAQDVNIPFKQKAKTKSLCQKQAELIRSQQSCWHTHHRSALVSQSQSRLCFAWKRWNF